MNRSITRCLLVIMSIFTAMIITGCSQNEQTLLNAIIKTANVSTSECKSTVSIDLGAALADVKLSEDTNADFVKFIKGVKRIKIEATEKIKRSDDDLLNQVEGQYTLNFGGIMTSVNLWADTDFRDGKQNGKQLIQYPPIFSIAMPAEFAGKEYFEVDMNSYKDMLSEMSQNSKKLSRYSQSSFMDSSMAAINPGKLTENMTKDLCEMFKVVSKSFEPGFEVVNNKGIVEKNGEEYTVYEMKMNDKQFKLFFKNLALLIEENPDMRDFIKKRVLMVMGKESEPIIDVMFKSFDKTLPDIKNKTEKIFASMDKINLLGKNGLVVEFWVDKNDFVREISGSLGFDIDREILKLVNKTSDVQTNAQNVSISIKFENVITEINNDWNLQFPQIAETEKITIADVSKLLKANAQKEEEKIKEYEKMCIEAEQNYAKERVEKGIITLKINGLKVYDEYENNLKIYDGRLIAPVSLVLNELGIDYTWDPQGKRLICRKDEDTKVLIENEKIVEDNGEKREIKFAPQIMDGKIYVSIKDFCDLYNAKIEWDQESLTANVIYDISEETSYDEAY